MEVIFIDNSKAEIKDGENTYIISRVDFERKFQMYWFSADIVKKITNLYRKYKKWFIQFKK